MPPTQYSENMTNKICDLVASGLSLIDISKKYGYPSVFVLYRWRREYTEFEEALSIAFEINADRLAYRALEISNEDTDDDYTEESRKDGSTYKVFNSQHVARAKLRVSAYQWMATKQGRKAWGDKKSVDIEGTLNVQHISDDEIQRRLTAANTRLIDITPSHVDPVVPMATDQGPAQAESPQITDNTGPSWGEGDQENVKTKVEMKRKPSAP